MPSLGTADFYGKDFVPFNSYYGSGSNATTTSAGNWTEIQTSTTDDFYPINMPASSDGIPVEVGYGPAGAERAVAQWLTCYPFPFPGNLVPRGSRLVVKAASGAFHCGVVGIKASAWGPDPVVDYSRRKLVVPNTALTTIGSNTTIVTALPYPFVLTGIRWSGASGTADVTMTIKAGRSSTEAVPIYSAEVYRPDTLGSGFIELRPRPWALSAGWTIVGNMSAGTMGIRLAGYRLDY